MTHPWPMFPPEANYYSLALGVGPAPLLAAAEAYAGHHAAMTATVGTSSAMSAVTAASYVGVSGTASEATLVAHNNEHLAFAEETLARSQILHMAAAAHPATMSQMVPAPPIHANRLEEATDELINPLVWGALTPRIVELNTEYFGFMWPNNAAAGLRYGATLDALGSALMAPSMPAISGGSIAAAAVAAATVAESAAMSGMQAAVGTVGSGVSALSGPASALPATAMSAVSSSGSSVASAPVSSTSAQPLSAITHTAPPTPAQTTTPAQSSAGMYAPSPNANLMTPPPVPPTTAQPSVAQPMMPRPPLSPPMPAAPGITSFTPPAEPFSPPPPPAGRAAGPKQGMLNAAALRGPVSTMPLTTATATATQSLAYVHPDVPRPVQTPPPAQPPLDTSGTVNTLNPPPAPAQQPPAPSAQPQPSPPAAPQTGPPSSNNGGGPGAATDTQMLGSGPSGAPEAPTFPIPLDPVPPVDPKGMTEAEARAAWDAVNADINAWNARCGRTFVIPTEQAAYDACIADKGPLLDRQAAIRARLKDLGVPIEGEEPAHHPQTAEPPFPPPRQITGLTEHGAGQVNARDGHGVNDSAMQDAVANPTRPPIFEPDQYGGAYEYDGKDATVILNKDGQVVTAWANSRNGWRNP